MPDQIQNQEPAAGSPHVPDHGNIFFRRKMMRQKRADRDVRVRQQIARGIRRNHRDIQDAPRFQVNPDHIHAQAFAEVHQKVAAAAANVEDAVYGPGVGFQEAFNGGEAPQQTVEQR